MSRLPSLSGLHVFVTAARLLSLTRTAEVLAVTQSAVSRRIALLEAELGMPLFERHRRGMRLTPAGEAYAQEIEPAFRIISGATRRLREDVGVEPLRLKVYTTFAVKWLLPRLPLFEAQNPDLSVVLDTTVAPVNFVRDKIDLAVQFGAGNWEGLKTDLLLADTIDAVCAPSVAKQCLEPDVLSKGKVRILDAHYRRADWKEWSRHAGIELDGISRMEFASSFLSYQAAVQGLGVAMGQINLLTEDLASGALVRPFSKPLCRNLGYYLVAPRERTEPRRTRAFRKWIIQRARADELQITESLPANLKRATPSGARKSQP